MGQLSPQQIKDMINRFIHECLDYEERNRLDYRAVYDGQGDMPDLPDPTLTIVDDFTKDAQHQLKTGDYSQVSRVVDHILEVNNCQVPKDSSDYKALSRETLKAQIKVLAIEKRRNEGDYSDDTSLPQRPQTTPISPPKAVPSAPAFLSGPSFKDLVAEWKAENMRADLWKPRTVTAYDGHLLIGMQ